MKFKHLMILGLLFCVTISILGCNHNKDNEIKITTNDSAVNETATEETDRPTVEETTDKEIINHETITAREYNFKGNYIGEENPYNTLKIKKGKNEKYKISMFIHRLDKIKGTSNLDGDSLIFEGVSSCTSEESGYNESAKVTFTITPSGNDVILVCTKSNHPYIPVGESFHFCKRIIPITLSSSDSTYQSAYTVDLDGDGKDDEIKLWEDVKEEDNYATGHISINGEEMIYDCVDDTYGNMPVTVQIYDINNKKIMWIYAGWRLALTDYQGELYCYNNGIIQQVFENVKIGQYVSYSEDDVPFVTDKVILDKHMKQFSSIGIAKWYMAYKFDNNEWKQMWEEAAGDSLDYTCYYKNELIGEFTATKKVHISKSIDNEDIITIHKNDKVVVCSIVEKEDGTYMIGVIVNPEKDVKRGYYEDSDGNENEFSGLFKETIENFAD